MLIFKPHAPYNICLFTTFRCNASCENCCIGCRPNNGLTMSLEMMKHYIDLCLEAYPESITRLALSGGECFLLGDDLEAIIRYGTLKGLSVDVISNGYWGKSYRNALNLMKKLKEAGLKAITFSTGEDHQKWVPYKYCRNAAVAAARLNIPTHVRIENHYGYVKCQKLIDTDKAFANLINSNRINLTRWNWEKYNNELRHERLYAHRIQPYHQNRPCKFLFNDIILTPYGDVLACCGISATRIPYMRLGNINKEPIKDIYERAFQDALKVWIYTEGASAVLKYVYDNSNIRFHEYGDGCKSCNEIFNNPKIIPFLRERYYDWANKIIYTFI